MVDHSLLLQAVHKAARKLSSSGNQDDVLREVLHICVEAASASGGTIYLHDPERKKLQFRYVLPEEVAQTLELKDIPENFGVAGQVFTSRRSVISTFEPEDEERRAVTNAVGVAQAVRSMITVPLMMDDEPPIGVVQLVNKSEGGTFNGNDAMVLDTVSAICTMAYLNWQLVSEQSRSSTLLGMGKVGHDIKNLAFALEANLSFSDEVIKGLRAEIGENPAIDDISMMIEDFSLSIDRIKRYSILMSDLSAGKALNPSLRTAPLASTIQLSAAFLESEARARCVRLEYAIQNDAPAFLHDEMYMFRIVQNLVSNAVKAVAETVTETDPDSDQATWKPVIVSYKFEDNQHILEVIDSGPGMDRETANRILKGNARSVWGKSSGSGWGTKIILELAATHDGVVEIDSEVGKGTTFRVRFPHRV